MKKIMRFADLMAIVVSCVIMSGCNAGMIESSYDYDGKAAPAKPRKISCGLVKNEVSFGGVVTRAESETLDGNLTITSTMLAKFVKYPEGKADTVKHTYVSLNEVKAFNVKAPKYLKSADVLKEAVLKQIDTDLWKLSFGGAHLSLKTVHTVKEKSYKVDDTDFELCQNDISGISLDRVEYQYLQRDSAGYRLYQGIPHFKLTLEEGNPITFSTPFNFWVPNGGGTPIIPEDEPEVIAYESDPDESWWRWISPGKNERGIVLHPRRSDGSIGKNAEVSFIVPDSISSPAKQEKRVQSLEWEAAKASIASPVKDGGLRSIGDSIFHQPMKMTAVTRTDKGSCEFVGHYDGVAYYVDKFGVKHQFADRPYTMVDKGWTGKDLSVKDNLEGKLLTSTVTGSINGHSSEGKGEIEIRKAKDAEKKIIDFVYPEDASEMGIRCIVPNQEYEVWRNRYAKYNDDTISPEKYDEVSFPYFEEVVTPDKQTIDVNDWNISDAKMVETILRNNTREIEVAEGKARIHKWEHRVTTKTNKSSHVFNVFAEKTSTFTDKFGNTVEMPTLDIAITDKGAANTMNDLPEKDGKARKAMTSTIEVTANKADKAEYAAEVEFLKDATDHLTKAPEVAKSLVYNGNGSWTTKATITYDWKIAGVKTKPLSEPLFWGITGENKKQVILNEATADYNTYNKSAEASSSAPSATNEGVTVNTTTYKYIEDYTTLKDNYEVKKQTASYHEEVDGYTVEFDFLAPDELAVAHKSASLTDTQTTTNYQGEEYDLWYHKGSVTATVTSSIGNKTENAEVEKDVLVKIAPVTPSHPEWGAVKGFIAATAGYNKDAGESGRFHGVHLIEFEKGVLVVHTESFGGDGNAWTPRDYTYSEADFYTYGVEIEKTWNLNTAMLWEGKWIPALWSWDNNSDNPGWTVECINNKFYKMPSALALTCGIKNFQGSDTAKTTPVLHHSGQLKGGKLYVKNEKGGLLYTIW